MSKKPNILYLMTDQQKASACSVYGNPHAKCDFMDKIASSGVAFTEAYAPSSICTPSRTSVFTGVHPLVHQSTCHQNRAPLNLPQLPEILANNGYYTAVVGHYEYGRDLNRGWHQQVCEYTSGPLKKAYSTWFTEGNSKKAPSYGTLKEPAESGHAHAVTDRAIMMLDDIIASDMPFFLHVPYFEPHPPYLTHNEYSALLDSKDLPLPQKGCPENRPSWQSKALKEWGDISEEDSRKVLATYYGMIAYANDEMQRLYDALDARNMLDNTWIIVSSDHGDYTGEKGLFHKSESLYECLLHVPLIIRSPKHVSWPAGTKNRELVDLTDLFPTILKMAGIEIPEYTQGKDLIEWIGRNKTEALHDYLFAQVGNYHGFLKNSSRNGGHLESYRHPSLLQGVRNKHFSYTNDPDYGDEAYNLKTDPKELKNIINTNCKAESLEISELRKKTRQWEKECLELRKELEVIPGHRGFNKGWE
ncbi:MAG: sulfatase [Sedimentisphaeraceae bacterium JB056]